MKEPTEAFLEDMGERGLCLEEDLQSLNLGMGYLSHFNDDFHMYDDLYAYSLLPHAKLDMNVSYRENDEHDSLCDVLDYLINDAYIHELYDDSLPSCIDDLVGSYSYLDDTIPTSCDDEVDDDCALDLVDGVSVHEHLDDEFNLFANPYELSDDDDFRVEHEHTPYPLVLAHGHTPTFMMRLLDSYDMSLNDQSGCPRLVF